MKINKLNSDEAKVKKLLYNVQGCVNKVRSNEPIKPEKLARDLYVVGNKCKTPEKGNILTNCLTALAEKMLNMKQDNLAGVIYSFLIKFNKDNLIVLKKLVPKALEIAQMQKDSVHVAARTGELAQIYKNYDIHGTNYLKCLHVRKQALKDICSNYDTVGDRFRTISRQINKKDTYIELLIKTKIDIANELMVTNKSDAKRELLSAYKKLNMFSDSYKVDYERSYSMLKKHISIDLTNIMLGNSASITDAGEEFSKVRKSVLEAVKEGAPIENSIFNEHFSKIYDAHKNNSLEDRFVRKAINFVEEINAAGNSILANNICRILVEKNQNNVKNLKDINMVQLKMRDVAGDTLGVLYYSTLIQKLFKKDSNAVSVSTYLKSLQFNMKALNRIITNYEDFLKMPQIHRLRAKDEYKEQLIFAKVNSAILQRNTNPEYSKKSFLEAENLIEQLPAGYVTKHPELRKIISIVTQYVD